VPPIPKKYHEKTKALLEKIRQVKCKACEGTGISSKGKPCYPCDGTGKQKS